MTRGGGNAASYAVQLHQFHHVSDLYATDSGLYNTQHHPSSQLTDFITEE